MTQLEKRESPCTPCWMGTDWNGKECEENCRGGDCSHHHNVKTLEKVNGDIEGKD